MNSMQYHIVSILFSAILLFVGSILIFTPGDVVRSAVFAIVVATLLHLLGNKYDRALQAKADAAARARRSGLK